MEGVDGEMSLRRAWITMRDQQIDTLCVVDKERNLKGLITVKDVATANMDVLDTYILAESETSYQNIVVNPGRQGAGGRHHRQEGGGAHRHRLGKRGTDGAVHLQRGHRHRGQPQ